jgi:hypothetical protein
MQKKESTPSWTDSVKSNKMDRQLAKIKKGKTHKHYYNRTISTPVGLQKTRASWTNLC